MSIAARAPVVHSTLIVEALEGRRLLTIPGTTLGVWDTYATYSAELQTIHNAYPSLTSLVSIGKTVQNRDLWALRITDNPTVQEDEPEVLWNGPLHGDETVGLEMNYYFIQHLLENYGAATAEGTRVTNIVNNMDVWVLPSANWDGYSRAGGAWRYNANGIDLNRNFPEWTTRSFSSNTVRFGPYGNMFDGPAPNTAGLQAETAVIMNFRSGRHFVVSANLHGGELVVNYPWDSNGNAGADYAVAPDDNVWRELALTYSRQNGPMFANNSAPFINGTTNGDNWYPVSGGEQDWAVGYTGSFETTIELGYTKFPAASTLPTYWSQNREAMMQYTEAANWGVRGLVTRSTDGLPLFAKVTVIAPASTPTPDPSHPAQIAVFSDREQGDYHRMLLPGTYTLKFEAPGYQALTQQVTVTAKTGDPNSTARMDVQLVPLDTTPPAVTEASFAFQTAPLGVNFLFSENVAPTLTVEDLQLRNLTAGRLYTAAELALNYNPATFAAAFTVPGEPGGVLPDGNYSATVRARGVRDAWGNQLAADGNLSFFVFAGDADRDRDVDIADFSILAGRFNQPGTFGEGDFNYDGQVGIGDFSILAGKFNTALPALRAGLTAQPGSAPAASAGVPTGFAVRTDDRVSTGILAGDAAAGVI